MREVKLFDTILTFRQHDPSLLRYGLKVASSFPQKRGGLIATFLLAFIHMQTVIGKKLEQTQKFLTDGTRIPVTVVATPGNPVVSVKTKDKDGYWAMQLGFGIKKHANKPLAGHVKKAQLEKAPFALKEVRLSDKEAESLPELGQILAVETVFEAGDIVDVTGKSKGKGFAGGVKRHNFKGGPRTHGQSDRERAPGSVGQTTTPGRVYKGKRMAGKMGNDTVTLKNLEVVKVGKDFVWVKGVVPGPLGAVITIKATGKKNKKFVEVIKTEEELAAEALAQQAVEEEARKAAAAELEAKKTEEAAAKAATETPVEEVKTEVAPEEVATVEAEAVKTEVTEETKGEEVKE